MAVLNRTTEVDAGPRSGVLDSLPNNPTGWVDAWKADGWGAEGDTCGGACAESVTPDGVRVVPLLCGKWSCLVCGKLRARWFQANVVDAICDHHLLNLWTLTLDHKAFTAGESWLAISDAWEKFKGMMTRKCGRFTYLWVKEPQKSGHAHLHVLVDASWEKKVVRRLWRKAAGGSYIVDQQEVSAHGLALYLTKYMSKGAGHELRMPDGSLISNAHRFGRSRCIQFSPFREPKGGWEMVKMAFKEYLGKAQGTAGFKWESERGVPCFFWTGGSGIARAAGIAGETDEIWWLTDDVYRGAQAGG